MVGTSKLALAAALAVAPAALGTEAVRGEVDRLVASIAAARHLTYHGTLPVQVVDRAGAARQAERLDAQADADPAARDDAELLRRLGLGAPPRDEGDVPGASPRFDAVTGRLWVPSFVPLEAQQVALAHEVAHAVADQRFGFRRLMEIGPDGRSRLSGDARRARLAVVEGDAMLTGLELLDPRESFLGAHALTGLAGRLRAAGCALTELGVAQRSRRGRSKEPSQGSCLIDPAGGWTATLAGFTHVDGLLFVARAREHHPWNVVDALWTDPPSSTEQILHPEKYESCEAPVTLEPSVLPALPGLGSPATTDVAGELVIRAWLATAWAPEVAARAAAGWGGDRAAVYGTPSAALAPDAGVAPAALSWLTVWDGPGEAEDFGRAAQVVLQRQAEKDAHDDASPSSRPDGVVFSSPRGLFGLARRGDAVALLIAAPEGSEPALDAMLNAVRRGSESSRRPASHPRPEALPGCLRRDRAGGSE